MEGAAETRKPGYGTNNQVLLITTAAGSFVWRVYSNLSRVQIQREHALLSWLVGRVAPLRVPVPMITMSGRTVHELPDGRVACLAKAIPGVRPGSSLAEVTAVAGAFARLLAVLTEAPLELAVHDWTREPFHAGFSETVDLDTIVTESRRIGLNVDWLMQAIEGEDDLRAALSRLPQQIVHGDIALSNSLVNNGTIAGVLDFEVSGWDARVTDLAAAMSSLGGDPASMTGRNRIDHVRAAYVAELGLSSQELGVVPACVLQRCAGSVLWRAKRWANGLGPLSEVLERVGAGAHYANHLTAYGA